MIGCSSRQLVQNQGPKWTISLSAALGDEDDKLNCRPGEQKLSAAVADNTTQHSSPESATVACDKTEDSVPDFYEEEDTVIRGIACNADDTSRVRRNVAIFADYDGCFDIISESNPDGAKMDKMFDYAKQIGRLICPKSHAQKILADFLDDISTGADKVVLFSGSNRQSRREDESNAAQNDNGLSMIGLKKLAEDRKWHFESRLLEDAGINPSNIMNSIGGSSEIKKLLAENNFRLLTDEAMKYARGKANNPEKYLKYTREKAKSLEHIEHRHPRRCPCRERHRHHPMFQGRGRYQLSHR